jgi:hypothetical protein
VVREEFTSDVVANFAFTGETFINFHLPVLLLFIIAGFYDPRLFLIALMIPQFPSYNVAVSWYFGKYIIKTGCD